MEFFKRTNHKLTKNNKEITAQPHTAHENGYGNISIKSMSKASHQWKFKILKKAMGATIGIVEEGHLRVNHPSFTEKGFGYGLGSDGSIYSANCNKKHHKMKKGDVKYTTGDVVMMKLDLLAQTLSFCINENNKSVVINKIKTNPQIQYKMAVYLSSLPSLELVEYNNNLQSMEKFEEKENFNDKNIIKQKEDIQLTEYQNKIETLQNQLNQTQIELEETTQANLRQRNTIIQFQNEANQNKIQIQLLTDQITKLKTENGTLIEEQKEMEMMIERLKAENKDLKIKNLDISKYENWDWQQIIEWILTIENSRFIKYENDLRKILSQEQPFGDDLQDVNEGDIKRWGITVFKDIKVLYKNIKILTNNKGDDNNLNIAIADNEGDESGGHYK